MKPSRQRAYQLKNLERGKCRQCPKPRTGATFCDECREKHNHRCLMAYRKRKGLPLDAPVKTRKP